VAVDPICPGCQGRNVGKVGTGQYYCWECFIEFQVGHRGTRMYRVEADGELSRIEPDAGLEGMTS
jgi:hypothetical protein